MSGGVDSSVAAYLSMEKYEKCAGATMKLLPGFDESDAEKITEKLGIPFFVFDFQREFRNCVIQPFIDTYSSGGTPNPCVECNRVMKFDMFAERAAMLGYDKMATGHYARVKYNEKSGRYLLTKAADISKDQSYFLYSLSQEQLANIYFPLGELTKDRVREIAAEQGFENARKKDSQDICFIPGGDYSEFIESCSGEEYPEGDFVDLDGNILGTHKGIIRYTIGQRKGLGLALPEPMYVFEKNVEENKVILCRDDQLFGDTVKATEINLISVENISRPTKVRAKIRYNQTEQPATVIQTLEDELRIVFDEPQRAIAKGQSVVMYEGDTVIGGGIIS